MLNPAGEPRQGHEDPGTRAGLCPLSTMPLLTNRQLVIPTLVILATKLFLVTVVLLFFSQKAPFTDTAGDPTSITESDTVVLQTSPSPTKRGAPTHEITTGPPQCQPSWELFQGSCYFFSGTTQSWQEARGNCRAQGADLVVISDPMEQDYLVRRAQSVRYWIGLTDQEHEGTWRWVDDTPLTLASWSEGEPNNELIVTPNGENCAHLLETGLWNDLPCHLSCRWICEKSARV